MNDTTTIDAIPANLPIAAPNPDQLRRGAASALDLVQGFEITDQATYGLAAEELQGIKRRIDALTEQRLGLTRPLDGVKAALMNLFRGPVDLLQQAEGILKNKMLAYTREQERIANEARIEAERRADEERKRLQDEADALAAQGRAGEAAVKEAVAAMVVAAPAVAAPAPAAKGISTRETVEHEVDDLAKLVAFIATGDGTKPLARPDLLGLILADGTKLRAYVRGLGMQTSLPGVRVYLKQSLAARKA